MKLLKTILFALPFILISCSDDPLSESIVGTYNVISFERNCLDPNESIALIEPDANGCLTIESETTCNVFIVFKEDGTAVETYTVDNGTDMDEYTYTVNDENKTISFCESLGDCETIKVDGDILTRTLIDDDCTLIVEYKKS